MVYVISGATGRTGAAAAQMLLDRGESVRVLVRNDAAAATWAAKGAETAMADFTDAGSMKTALTGAAGVYLMTPPLATSADLLADRIPIETNMIEALLCHDVPKIVLLSAFAAHLDSGTGQIVGLRRMEQRFADAGLPFTALRAAFFAENWAPRLCRSGGHRCAEQLCSSGGYDYRTGQHAGCRRRSGAGIDG